MKVFPVKIPFIGKYYKNIFLISIPINIAISFKILYSKINRFVRILGFITHSLVINVIYIFEATALFSLKHLNCYGLITHS